MAPSLVGIAHGSVRVGANDTGTAAATLAPRHNRCGPVSVMSTMSRPRTGARVGGVQAPPSSIQDPVRAAHESAARCGATVRVLGTVDEISAAFDLFNRIWGNDDWGAVPVNVMKAMAHSGNYVAGAWQQERLVGASVAFAWGELSERALHSHISGVLEDAQGHGVGFALKLHQRAWASERGYQRITWTFDPLVQRNAWFNLTKLGARIEEYEPDFYGPMNDGINAGDATDRCLAVWDVRPGARPPDTSVHHGDAVELLACGHGDEPLIAGEPPARAEALSCRVPRDIIGLRRSDPALALRWRRALRETMGAAITDGYVASSITRDGSYILERRAGAP